METDLSIRGHKRERCGFVGKEDKPSPNPTNNRECWGVNFRRVECPNLSSRFAKSLCSGSLFA
jgi:hypothetical protein